MANDFSIYYYAAKAFLNTGNLFSLYKPQITQGGSYLYPPLAIIFLIPFTYFEFNLAFILFSLLNLLSLFIISIFIIKILYHYGITTNSWEAVLLPFVILAFFPVEQSFTSGQINIIILLLLTIFYFFFIKNKNFYANLFLLLATILKIFPIILVGFYIFKRKWNFIATFLAMLFISCLVSILIFDIPSNRHFIETLIAFQKETPGLNPHDISITSIIIRPFLFYDIPDHNKFANLFAILKMLILFLIFIYLYVISLNTIYSASNEWEILVFSLMISLVIVFSNLTWYYFGTFLVLPYILCIYVLRLSGFEKILISVSIILFCLYPLFSPSAPLLRLILEITGVNNFDYYYNYIYTFNPLAYAPLFFLVFILYRLKKGNALTACNGIALRVEK